jgi:hypothetical protein
MASPTQAYAQTYAGVLIFEEYDVRIYPFTGTLDSGTTCLSLPAPEAEPALSPSTTTLGKTQSMPGYESLTTLTFTRPGTARPLGHLIEELVVTGPAPFRPRGFPPCD